MALVARPSSVQPASSRMSETSLPELRPAAGKVRPSSSDAVPTLSKLGGQHQQHPQNPAGLTTASSSEEPPPVSGGSKFDYLVSSYEDDVANAAGPSHSYGGPPSASPDPNSAGGLYGNIALDPGLAHLDVQSLNGRQHVAADFDVDAGSGLNFPDLPSSLLDSGPEYEYSSHTQGTVFESAQDWRGDLEANAVYGLDQYDAHSTHYGQDGGAVHHAAWSGPTYDNGSEIAAYGTGHHHVDAYYAHEVTPQDMAPRSQLAPPVTADEGGHHGSVSPVLQGGEQYPAQAPSVLNGPVPKRRRESWDAPGAPAQPQPPQQQLQTSSQQQQPQGQLGAERSPQPTNVFIPNGGGGPGVQPVSHQQPLVPPPVGRLYPVRDAVPSQGVVNRQRMPSWNDSMASSGGGPSSGGSGNGQQGFAEPWHQANGGSVAPAGTAASLGPPPPPRPTRAASYSGVGSQGSDGMPPHPGHQYHNGGAPPPHPMDPYGNGGMQNPEAAAMYAHHSSASDAGSAYGGGGGGGGYHDGPMMHPYHPDLGHGGGHNVNDVVSAFSSSMEATMEAEGVAVCPYPRCDKTFAKNRSYNLKAHLRSHSQLKPFNCAHCPRSFSRKHDLERHARVHSGDKPYICEACGKGFPRSDALRRHWRVEKECGERAAEIEAGQPLPSLPPGASSVLAPAPIGSSVASMGNLGHAAAMYAPYPLRGHPLGQGNGNGGGMWDPHEQYEGSSVGPMRGRREDY